MGERTDASRTHTDRRAPVPGLPGRLCASIYALAITQRNARFDRGIGVTRLPVPVLSVGNLSVGGTGKTPMVMHLLGLLRRAGLNPCVAMRGYSRKPSRDKHSATPDETDAYARAFPGLPIVAQPDRIAGIRALLENSDPASRPDSVVLDDGFQHRRIARDLDLVLVDASRPPTSDRLLPAGFLREPLASLKRASGVIITHAELAAPDALRELSTAIARAHGRLPLAIARHVWTGLKSSSPAPPDASNPATRVGLDWLLDKRVLAVCAIGNPHGFFQCLEQTLGPGAGEQIVGRIALPDHDPFNDPTIDTIRRRLTESQATALLVTDKDWSKLRRIPPDDWPCPVVRPELSMVFDAGREGVEAAALSAAGAGR